MSHQVADNAGTDCFIRNLCPILGISLNDFIALDRHKNHHLLANLHLGLNRHDLDATLDAIVAQTGVTWTNTQSHCTDTLHQARSRVASSPEGLIPSALVLVHWTAHNNANDIKGGHAISWMLDWNHQGHYYDYRQHGTIADSELPHLAEGFDCWVDTIHFSDMNRLQAYYRGEVARARGSLAPSCPSTPSAIGATQYEHRAPSPSFSQPHSWPMPPSNTTQAPHPASGTPAHSAHTVIQPPQHQPAPNVAPPSGFGNLAFEPAPFARAHTWHVGISKPNSNSTYRPRR